MQLCVLYSNAQKPSVAPYCSWNANYFYLLYTTLVLPRELTYWVSYTIDYLLLVNILYIYLVCRFLKKINMSFPLLNLSRRTHWVMVVSQETLDKYLLNDWLSPFEPYLCFYFLHFLTQDSFTIYLHLVVKQKSDGEKRTNDHAYWLGLESLSILTYPHSQSPNCSAFPRLNSLSKSLQTSIVSIPSRESYSFLHLVLFDSHNLPWNYWNKTSKH